jgi:N,N'-diacetylbacillosaminyl-diphospho-undecaprenol alpha-1,3-N-acetylgalactosaminyltransferase
MVQKKLLPQGKVKIIKSVGVDTKKFSMERYTPQKLHAIKEKLGLENKKIVLMVARAIWDKGIKEYYDAAKIIDATCQGTVFVFVGGTDVGNPSCAGETFLQSSSVRWLGHRDDIADLIAVSDVFILPSYREGFPVTLMEAASMAKPIVTTNTFGCKEAVEDGKNGFLVPLRDAKALACKIELLLSDEALRLQMGQSGREKALEEFASEKVVAQYMEYYETFF